MWRRRRQRKDGRRIRWFAVRFQSTSNPSASRAASRPSPDANVRRVATMQVSEHQLKGPSFQRAFDVLPGVEDRLGRTVGLLAHFLPAMGRRISDAVQREDACRPQRGEGALQRVAAGAVYTGLLVAGMVFQSLARVARHLRAELGGHIVLEEFIETFLLIPRIRYSECEHVHERALPPFELFHAEVFQGSGGAAASSSPRLRPRWTGRRGPRALAAPR